jgi:hypothetical protein
MRSGYIRPCRTLPPYARGRPLTSPRQSPVEQRCRVNKILDDILDRAEEEGYLDPLGTDTGITSVHDQVSVQGTVIQGDASVTSTRGGVDHDDAATQVDEDLTMQPPSVTRRRDWDRELLSSTDPAVTQVRRQSPKKTSISTLRDTMAKPKPAGIAVTAVADNQPPLATVGVPPRRAAAKPARPRPTVSDVRSLQD